MPVFSHVSDEDADRHIDGQHVVGILPPHLRTRASLVTQFDYNPQTREYGAQATYQTEIMIRTPIGEP